MRKEGKTFREIAVALNRAGYLTKTRREFNFGSAYEIFKKGPKTKYELRGDGPVLPNRVRNIRKGKPVHQAKEKVTRGFNPTQMILDVATSNLAETNKNRPISLIAKEL